MSFRFITQSIHAYLIDYPVAIVLIAAPFVLKLGQSVLRRALDPAVPIDLRAVVSVRSLHIRQRLT